MLTTQFIQRYFPKGSLSILSGYKGVGKTTFALNIALSLAKEGIISLYLSNEFSKIHIVRKCIEISSGISVDKLNEISKETDIEPYNNALYNDLENYPLYISDELYLTFTEITQYIKECTPEYLIIDDFYNINNIDNINRYHSRTERDLNTLNALIKIAKENSIAIIVLLRLPGGIGTIDDKVPPCFTNIKEYFGSSILSSKFNTFFLHSNDLFHIHEDDYVPTNELEFKQFVDNEYDTTLLEYNREVGQISVLPAII